MEKKLRDDSVSDPAVAVRTPQERGAAAGDRPEPRIGRLLQECGAPGRNVAWTIGESECLRSIPVWTDDPGGGERQQSSRRSMKIQLEWNSETSEKV